MDLLADGVREHNPIALHNPLSVDSQTAEQQSDFLVCEDASSLRPLNNVFSFRHLADEKVLCFPPVTEKKRSFRDHASIVGDSIPLGLLRLWQKELLGICANPDYRKLVQARRGLPLALRE